MGRVAHVAEQRQQAEQQGIGRQQDRILANGVGAVAGEDAGQGVRVHEGGIWVVMHQTTTDAPNYFVTRDFVDFKQISNVRPNLNYNWMTTELITWTLPNGIITQGVLYRPENFDSTKRHPVIFHYYQEFSHAYNQFPVLKLTGGDMNIPWFVSHGYFSFYPGLSLFKRKHG